MFPYRKKYKPALWVTILSSTDGSPKSGTTTGKTSFAPADNSNVERRAERKAGPPPLRRPCAKSAALAIYTGMKKSALRCRHVCECCGKRRRLDVHHVRGRLGSLLIDARFWKFVCRTCHNWIGDNPDAARARGLLCEKGFWNTAPDDEQTKRLKDLIDERRRSDSV